MDKREHKEPREDDRSQKPREAGGGNVDPGKTPGSAEDGGKGLVNPVSDMPGKTPGLAEGPL